MGSAKKNGVKPLRNSGLSKNDHSIYGIFEGSAWLSIRLEKDPQEFRESFVI